MEKQVTFASLAYDSKKKVTRREKFLNEMEAVIPWVRLEKLVDAVYPDIGNGRQPMGVRKMLRIYFMQQWFQLSDPGMEDTLYESESMRRFAGIELGRDSVPDETTILKFRHLLEEHNLAQGIFKEVNGYLKDKGMILKQGTIVDATIISAPQSTKNKNRRTDPEMHYTQNNRKWFFGMKLHIGIDKESGIAHSACFSAANIHEVEVIEKLLHGEEREIYGDKGYCSAKRKFYFESRGVKWNVARRPSRGRPLSERDERWNRHRNKVRLRVEHVFGLIKNTWHYTKTRYKGIKKNASQILTMLALANLYRARSALLAA